MTDDARNLGIGELLRDRRAELRVGLIVLGHQLELDGLAADLDLFRGGLLDREAGAILVVLAEMRDAAGQRAGMADPHGDGVVGGGRGLGSFGGFFRLFLLAAAVGGDKRGAHEHEAELLRELHGGPPEGIERRNVYCGAKRIIISSGGSSVNAGAGRDAAARCASHQRGRGPSQPAAACRAGVAATRKPGLRFARG